MTRRRTRWLAALVAVLAVGVTTIRLFTPASVPQAGPDAVDVSATSSGSTASFAPTPTTASSVPTAPTTSAPASLDPSPPPVIEPEAYAAVDTEGSAPVILRLDVEPVGTDAERAAQVQRALDRVVDALPAGSYANVRQGYTVPVVPITVDRAGLDALATAPVRAVMASRLYEPVQTVVGPESVNATTFEGAPAAWSAGKRGTGAAVAVVDTGVDVGHPFLTATPKTVWEACFATVTSSGFQSPCASKPPMTVTSAPVPGAATPCPVTAAAQCMHGTHVAGIAVGGTGTPGTSVSGIAPDADLVAVNVFSYNPTSGRVVATDADIHDALQWLYEKRATFPGLAAVNLSLGDRSPRSDFCDDGQYFSKIEQLATAGIATVIAAGNDGVDDGVSSPGCVSMAITVGSVDDVSGQRASYSNVGRQVAVMAAGGGLTASSGICSSVPPGSGLQPCPAPNGGSMRFMSGTSMATPAVSGAVALLRADAVPFAEWRARLQRVAEAEDCVQAAAYAIPSLRVDVALGLATRRASPCAPNAPMASTLDADSATVSWLPPLAPGTGTLTTSTVTASTGQTCAAIAPATTCVVTGLPLSSAITFTVRATSTTGTSGPSVATAPVATRTVVPVTPARIADTRPPSQWGSTVDGLSLGRGPLSGGSTWSVRVLGRGGVPASGVGAVALNVTVTRPTAAGYLTVWPGGLPRPTSSNLNFTAGQTVPNLVNVGVGGNGMVSVFNQSGSTDVIIDVVGWYPEPTGYEAVVPARLLDTRAGYPTIDGAFSGVGALGAGASLSLTVTGRGDVPVGAGAVVLNVTAVDPTRPGFLTVYPTGSAVPNASNLNFVAGQVVPNAVIAAVGAGGKVDIYNLAGSTDVVVDVLGWLPAGGQYHPIGPARLLDTRPPGPGISTVDGQQLGGGAIGSGATLVLPVVGRTGIPPEAYAVAVNVTAVAPTATGFLTVYPSGVGRPVASSLNFVPGQVVPNLVVSGLGADGRLAIYNFTGSTQVVVDIVGWYG